MENQLNENQINENQINEQSEVIKNTNYTNDSFTYNAPVKQRRVGTFTLGLTLILIGVLIPLTLFFKERALFLVQLAPVMIVVLGIEVLFYAFKQKDGKYKYDGLSIFLILLLTVTSIAAATITPMVKAGIENTRVINAARMNGTTSIEKALLDSGITGFGYAYFSRSENIEYFSSLKADYVADNMSAVVNIEWQDLKNYPTKEEMAEKIAAFLNELEYKFDNISVRVEIEGEKVAYCSISAFQMQNFTKENLLEKLRLSKYWVLNKDGKIAKEYENKTKNSVSEVGYQDAETGETDIIGYIDIELNDDMGILSKNLIAKEIFVHKNKLEYDNDSLEYRVLYENEEVAKYFINNEIIKAVTFENIKDKMKISDNWKVNDDETIVKA